MAVLAKVRPENGAAGGGYDAVPMRQASVAEPERTELTAMLGIADAVRVAALLVCSRQRTDDARVMITRASNVPMASRRALDSSNPLAAPCSWVFTSIARRSLPRALSAERCWPGLHGQCRAGREDSRSIPTKHGQAKPSESIPNCSGCLLSCP